MQLPYLVNAPALSALLAVTQAANFARPVWSNPRKPGPKGPSAELIAAIVEMKCRNPKFGYMKIAVQISHASAKINVVRFCGFLWSIM